MLASFVQETANAPGSTITIALGGAAIGRRSFASAFASGAACYYAMDDGSQGEWGIGTITHGTPATLTRTTVLGNTIGTTTRMTFTGLTRVYVTLPAERALWRNAEGDVDLSGAAITVAPAGVGRVGLRAGSAANPGYVEFFTPEGTRRGYIGWQDPGNSLAIVAEAGWSWRVTGTLAVAGLLSALGNLAISGAAGTGRRLDWQTAGSSRWHGRADGTAESGGNAGSNFVFAAHSDAGVDLGAVYTINRASRVMDFALNPTTGGVLAGAVPNRQVFAASGTWTKPAGYPADTLVLVECWGAGGGGSTSGGNTGGGGGGGAYNQRLMRLGDLGATETVTIGAAGATGATGGVGGTSSFGTRLEAFGGGGGASGGGGGGGGVFGAGSSGSGSGAGMGGPPENGFGTRDNQFGGGRGGGGFDEFGTFQPDGGGRSADGGGGGGGGLPGGRSNRGSGGGGSGAAGAGGVSLHGGFGGTAGTNNAQAPGGGGGRGQPGARGEVRVTVIA